MTGNPKKVNSGILRYATDKERMYIEDYNRTLNQQTTADNFGVSKNSVCNAIKRAKRRAAKQGYSPEHDMTHEAPDGFHVKGTSTLYDKEGYIRAQWVKTKKDEEELLQNIFDIVSDISSDVRGDSVLYPAPEIITTGLLTLYTIADPHFGLYSWEEETGANFDLDIAEKLLTEMMVRLIQSSPASEVAIIANLGDFFHSDNDKNITPKSGNPLDSDSRWAKVVRVGIRTLRNCIDLASQKHQKVIVFNEIGNHDIHSSIILSTIMDAIYENNDRIEIITSPKKFHYYKYGKNLFGFTHGDTVKPEILGQIMATDVAKEWGDTEHRFWFIGHIHHKTVLEMPGCTVESFNTIAAPDAWTSGMGFRSQRNMSSIVFRETGGEKERHKINIGDLNLEEEIKKV